MPKLKPNYKYRITTVVECEGRRSYSKTFIYAGECYR